MTLLIKRNQNSIQKFHYKLFIDYHHNYENTFNKKFVKCKDYLTQESNFQPLKKKKQKYDIKKIDQLSAT